MKFTALLPVKQHSERVPNKNLRLFNGQSLFTWVMNTLQQCPSVAEILVNTDSAEVTNYVREFIPKGKVIDRPTHLMGHLVTMNTLIEHDMQHTGAEHFIQTHATNPLLTANTIERALKEYENALAKHNSLFAVTRILNRLYDEKGQPLNHSNTHMQRTQDMKPVYEENSNFFIFSRTSFRDAGNSRVGKKPQVYVMNKVEAMDIDYEEDFLLAELVHRNRPQFGNIFTQP